MNKKLNNTLLLLFPAGIIILYGLLITLGIEVAETMELIGTSQFHWYYRVINILFFLLTGAFMYYFIKKDRDFNIISGVIGVIIAVVLLNPTILWFLSDGLYSKIYSDINSWRQGIVIATFVVAILVKKRRSLKKE